MTIFGRLRSLYSPYELAVGGRLVDLAIFALAVVMAVTGHEAAFFLLLGPAALLHLLTGELSRCRTCGKRPTKLYLLDRETGIGQLLFIERWWPERLCSSCRTSLDGI